MIPTDSAAKYLADQLERLMILPLGSASDLEDWYQQADEVEQTLRQRFPDFIPDGEVWHFLADADIRFRESSYGDYQHDLMVAYAQQLRRE